MIIQYVASMERSMAFYKSANTFNNVFNRQARPQMINLLGRGGTQDLDKIMEIYNEAITGEKAHLRLNLVKVLTII